MSYAQAIVWLDHRQASITEFSAGSHKFSMIRSSADAANVHHKAGQRGTGRVADDVEFFATIADRIAAPEVLLVGPGTAKLSFQRFVRTHDPDLAQRIVGVETMDHPTSAQLLAHGRRFFHRFDQLAGEARTSAGR